jgi:hypothetical protein
MKIYSLPLNLKYIIGFVFILQVKLAPIYIIRFYTWSIGAIVTSSPEGILGLTLASTHYQHHHNHELGVCNSFRRWHLLPHHASSPKNKLFRSDCRYSTSLNMTQRRSPKSQTHGNTARLDG